MNPADEFLKRELDCQRPGSEWRRDGASVPRNSSATKRWQHLDSR
jgi:hypothetical protein